MDFEANVAGLNPAKFCKSLAEYGHTSLGGGIVLAETYQRADTFDLPGLLRPRRQRPCRRRAAEERDELAPADHSITSSAVASSVGGTVSPSILAIWALITNSNLLDCTTGRSAGFAPLRIRPV